MSSGRSFSEARHRRRERLRLPALAATAGLFATAAWLGASAAAMAQSLPPPPENEDVTATPTPAPSGRAAAPRPTPPRFVTCARCGYQCDPGWHFCVSCGWDLTTLTGEAEEARLDLIGRAAVGVTVGGMRRNRYATAFPFGATGLLLTNARVLVGAAQDQVKIRTFNNREFPSTIVGYDLPSGVGLIKPGSPFVHEVETAPAPPQPSEAGWAVCYPVVFEDDIVRYMPVSVHRGHLNATGQSGSYFVSFENLLRTDHAIEAGCTGGPLVDSRGRVAGMILGSPDDGLTYALPIAGLQPIVDALIRHEKPIRPYLGLGLVVPDDRRRSRFGLDAQSAGPLVAYVIPGSPAARAGVQAGELLLAVDGGKVSTVWEAGARLLAAAPGGPALALTLGRGGGERQVTVQPIKRPERVMLEPIDELQETLEANLKEVATGPTDQQGLRVIDLVRGGRGEKARFRNGDTIMTVDKKSVRSFQGFNDAIRSKNPDLFKEDAPGNKVFGSSYDVNLEVRPEGGSKVTRTYVNMFPDFLAPPVY